MNPRRWSTVGLASVVALAGAATVAMSQSAVAATNVMAAHTSSPASSALSRATASALGETAETAAQSRGWAGSATIGRALQPSGTSGLAAALAAGTIGSTSGPPTVPNPNALLTSALAGGPKIFGISPSSNSAGVANVPAISAALAHPINIVNIYMGWGNVLPVATLQQIEAEGAVPEITFEPGRTYGSVVQPTMTDAMIASGAYDSYLTTVAQAAAAWPHPLLFRYAHEMNGNWYPWSAIANTNTPATYVAAWQHVHKLFTAAGASNVLWVYSPNIGNQVVAAESYPGASYVNIVALDGYNSLARYNRWQTPAQIFGLSLTDLQAAAPGKPAIIAETGSAEAGGSKADWLEQLFSWAGAQPGLDGVVYSDYGTDWPFTTSASAEAGAKAGLADYGIGAAAAPLLAPASDVVSPAVKEEVAAR